MLLCIRLVSVSLDSLYALRASTNRTEILFSLNANIMLVTESASVNRSVRATPIEASTICHCVGVDPPNVFIAKEFQSAVGKDMPLS